MKRSSVRFVFIAALFCIGFAAGPSYAATTWETYSDGTRNYLKITVPKGETIELSDVDSTFTEFNFTAASPYTDHLYYGHSIDKRGEGTLKNTKLDLSGWWGSVFINGGVVENNGQSMLGANSIYYPILIAAGSTLIIDPYFATDATPKKVVQVGGDGAEGHFGGLEIHCIYNYNAKYNLSYQEWVFPGTIQVLRSPAFVSVQNKGCSDPQFKGKTLNLNGGTMVLNGTGGNARTKMHFWGSTVTPGNRFGQLVVSNDLTFVSRNASKYESSNSGYDTDLVLTGTGCLNLCGNNEGNSTYSYPDHGLASDGNAYWRLVIDSDTCWIDPVDMASASYKQSANVWHGRMQLNTSANINMTGDHWWSTSARYGLLTLKDKISGPGGIRGLGVVKANCYDYLTLSSAQNDFTGGVALTNVNLALSQPTALPTAGASVLNNASLYFVEPASTGSAAASLPALTFDVPANATQRLASIRDTGIAGNVLAATAGTITKDGAGTLSVELNLTAADLVLRGGITTLPSTFALGAGGAIVGEGGVLDLQGATLSVARMRGKPAVKVNGGTLQVTGSWELTADQIKSATRLSGVAFGSDAVLTIAKEELDKLDENTAYVLADSFSGTLPKLSTTRWQLFLSAGKLSLRKLRGFSVIVR